MPANELDRFLGLWDAETANTLKLLNALPVNQYDFRPDAGGRSLGELAWHLAEIDGYSSYCIETGKFDLNTKVPNLERPRTVEALAPGFQNVHDEAVSRIRKLRPHDLDRTVSFFDGTPTAISELLWRWLLMHAIHHRGQLALLCRLAGGATPGVFGPNREEMAAIRAHTQKSP